MSLAVMVRSLTVLAALPDDEIDLLVHSFVEQRFPSGATIPLSFDGEALCLVIVTAGSVEWCGPSTTEFVNLWPGATFGDLSPDYRFDATVSIVARGTTAVAMLTRRACIAFFAAHPSASVSLVGAYAQALHIQQHQMHPNPRLY
jgi:hypothetical protein